MASREPPKSTCQVGTVAGNYAPWVVAKRCAATCLGVQQPRAGRTRSRGRLPLLDSGGCRFDTVDYFKRCWPELAGGRARSSREITRLIDNGNEVVREGKARRRHCREHGGVTFARSKLRSIGVYWGLGQDSVVDGRTLARLSRTLHEGSPVSSGIRSRSAPSGRPEVGGSQRGVGRSGSPTAEQDCFELGALGTTRSWHTAGDSIRRGLECPRQLSTTVSATTA